MEELRNLVIRASSGNSEAFEEIVRRFQDMARGYVFSILGDFSLAEDVAQEAFLDAYRQLPNLRNPEAFSSWFRRIVLKHCDRITRGKHIHTIPMEVAAVTMAGEVADSEKIIEDREIQGKVRETIQDLPENERIVTMLFYINSYSQKEIGEFLEVPATTKKKRLYSARKRLKRRMVDMVNEQVAWLAVNKAVQDTVRELTTSPRSKIISITIGGSLVRGDFIEDLSDVDVFTLVRGNIEEYWDSEEHKAFISYFDSYLSQYKGHSHNPFVWDDLSICEEDLPKTLDDLANQKIKALGIYLFDFIENHRTLYGEDFTRRLPQNSDPKSLVIPRINSLLKRAEKIINGTQNRDRIYLMGVEALKAVQLYFGEKPAIDKLAIEQVYRARVPDFPMKSFGWELWQNYIDPKVKIPINPGERYLEYIFKYIRDVQKLVKEYSSKH